MRQIELGEKVKYLYNGDWKTGVVHAVKTHEEPNGIITSISYLIDTGKTIREDLGYEKAPKNHKGDHVLFGDERHVPVTVRQPEQIEVGQNFIKPL